jgi:hypothetical protein
VAVALRAPDPADRAELERIGVTQLVLVEAPPATGAGAWMAELARAWR